MPQFIIKILKIGFLALLPVLLISNYEVELPIEEMGSNNGRYNLSSNEISNLDFNGEATYRISSEKTQDGEDILTLVLRLESSDEQNHSMEFLISQKNKMDRLSLGVYKLGGKIDGFIHRYNELFGFADIEALGELPFFAERGGITISQIEDNFLQGSLVMTMNNPDGKKFSISGEFVAMAE